MKIGRLWIHILPKGSRVQSGSQVYSLRWGQPSDAMPLDEVDEFLGWAGPIKAFDYIKSHYPDAKEFVYAEPTRSMHFNDVHWGYANGGTLPSGSEPVGRTTCPVEAVMTPADVEALRRAMNGEA